MKLNPLLALLAFPALIDCTPAQQAEASQVEAKLIADYKAGDSLSQMALDVALIVHPSNPVVDEIAVSVLDDAVMYLVDLGVLPAVFGATTHPQLMALKATLK